MKPQPTPIILPARAPKSPSLTSRPNTSNSLEYSSNQLSISLTQQTNIPNLTRPQNPDNKVTVPDSGEPLTNNLHSSDESSFDVRNPMFSISEFIGSLREQKRHELSDNLILDLFAQRLRMVSPNLRESTTVPMNIMSLLERYVVLQLGQSEQIQRYISLTHTFFIPSAQSPTPTGPESTFINNRSTPTFISNRSQLTVINNRSTSTVIST